MQEQQFLGRRALAGVEAEHLVRQVQPLVVGEQDLDRHAHLVADQQLALVAVVRLGDEGAEIGATPVSEAEVELVEQPIGRVIEQDRVVGEVHVAIMVDPLGPHLAAISVERRRKAQCLPHSRFEAITAPSAIAFSFLNEMSGSSLP